jgi:hypothetical protein
LGDAEGWFGIVTEPRSWALHEVLGMTEQGYSDLLEEDRLNRGEGVPVSLEPRFHSHPAFGISGHAHGTVAEARTPHVHRPVVEWDHESIPLFGTEGGPAT